MPKKQFLTPLKSHSYIYVGVAVLFLLVYYVVIIAQPLPFHLRGATVVDDTFYYLKYTQNIAAGLGPTYGGVFTNGVEPLWAALLVIPALLVKDHELFLRVALFIAALFNLGSVIVLWDLLRRWFSTNAGNVGLAIYVGFLVMTNVALTGMEISLCLFVFGLALWALITDRLYLLSATLILISLSRVDMLIFVPFFIAIALVGQSDWRRRLLVLLAPVVVVLGMYFFLNRAVFGVWLPISGEVKASVWQQSITPIYGNRLNPAYLVFTLGQAVQEIGQLLVWLFTPELRVNLFVGILLIVGLVAGLTLSAVKSVRQRRGSWKLLLGAAACIHIYAFYWQLGAGFVLYQSWYYSPEVLLMVVCIAVSTMHSRRLAYGGTALAVGCIAVFVTGIFTNQLSFSRGIYGLYEAALAVPENARVGSFSSGVIGYFGKATVINLDGLMNNVERLEAIRQNEPLIDYLKAHEIEYVADYGDSPVQGNIVSSGPMINEFGNLTRWWVVRVPIYANGASQ
jgi:hypothetical protein